MPGDWRRLPRPFAAQLTPLVARDPQRRRPGSLRVTLAAGALERWSAGALERWSAGALGRWSAGALGRWGAGALGRWGAGRAREHHQCVTATEPLHQLPSPSSAECAVYAAPTIQTLRELSRTDYPESQKVPSTLTARSHASRAELREATLTRGSPPSPRSPPSPAPRSARPRPPPTSAGSACRRFRDTPARSRAGCPDTPAGRSRTR